MAQTVDVYPDGAIVWCRNLIRAFTGIGYTAGGGTYAAKAPTVTEVGNSIKISLSGASYAGAYIMQDKIDLAPYSKACAIVGAGHSGAGQLQTANIGYSSTNTELNRVGGFFTISEAAASYITRDISAISGEYYIFHEVLNYLSGESYIEELQLWLE